MESWWDRIYLGDCVEVLEGWPEDRRVDMVFADPPYNIGYEYDVYEDNRPDEEYLRWLRAWIGACARVLAPHGSFWIAIGDEYAAEVKWIAQREVGLHLRSWVVWYYTFGVHCTRKFTRSHTHLLYFVRDPENFVFNSEAIRVPSARRMVYRDRRADPRGRVPDNTWILRPHDAWWAFQPEEDTWYIPRVAGTFRERAGFHGCQLPERLVARAILACTNPGDIVLDPFLGSGTTAVVARKLGRRWVGVELSRDYARLAEARIAAVRPGDPLVGPEDPLMSVKRRPASEPPMHLDFESHQALEIGLDIARTAGKQASEVLTDPALNVRFVDACHQAGLTGRPVDWNLAFLEQVLVVAELAGEEKESLPGDTFFQACDMAASRVLHQGYPGLETVLCEPRTALLYDSCARELAPGHATAEYRAELLRLLRAQRLATSVVRKCGNRGDMKLRSVGLEGMASADLPEAAGVFRIVGRESRGSVLPVYVGWGENLRNSYEFWASRAATVLGYLPRPAKLEFEWGLPGQSRQELARLVLEEIKARPPLFSALAETFAGSCRVG